MRSTGFISVNRQERPFSRPLPWQPSSQYDDESLSQDAKYSPITRYVSTETPILDSDSSTYTFLPLGISTSRIRRPHTCRVQESLVEYIPYLNIPNTRIRVSFFKRSSAILQILIPCVNTILKKFMIVVRLVIFVFLILSCRKQIKC